MCRYTLDACKFYVKMIDCVREQGIDPQAARSEDRFVRSRIIVPSRRHWMASKQGFYTTPYGMAYVHTDGSVAIFPHGTEHKCKCGMVHIT